MIIIVFAAVVVSLFKEWFETHVGIEPLAGMAFGACLAWAIWMAISEQLEDRP